MEYLIPHYGSPKLLHKAVRSILKNDPDAQVYIGDDSHELERGDFSHKVTIISGPNKGFAGNVNNLLGKARGEWVVIMNNDVVLADDWWKIMAEELKQVSETVYCLASSIFKPNGRVDSFGDGYSWYGQGYNRFHLLQPKVAMYKKTRVLGASGALMLVRRKVINLYKLSLALGSYCEDTAFHLQANNNGWQAWYIPDARATHVGSATFGMERKLNLSARNSLLVIRSLFAGRLRQRLLKRAYIYWKTKALFSRQYKTAILEGVTNGLKAKPFKTRTTISKWPPGLYIEGAFTSSFRLARQLLGGRLMNKINKLFSKNDIEN